jgi:hypothetical protein
MNGKVFPQWCLWILVISVEITVKKCSKVVLACLTGQVSGGSGAAFIAPTPAS